MAKLEPEYIHIIKVMNSGKYGSEYDCYWSTANKIFHQIDSGGITRDQYWNIEHKINEIDYYYLLRNPSDIDIEHDQLFILIITYWYYTLRDFFSFHKRVNVINKIIDIANKYKTHYPSGFLS